MSIDLSQFHQVFFEEAQEHLAEIENQLLAMDLETADAESLNAIFRAAHSIKGSGSMFGFVSISGFTHHLETLLDKVRQHEIELSQDIIDLVLESVDIIRAMADILRNGGEPDMDTDELVHRLEAAGNSVKSAEKTVSTDDEFGLFEDVVPAGQAAVDEDFGLFSDEPAAKAADESEAFGLFTEADSQPDTPAADHKPAPKATAKTPTKESKANVEAASLRVSVDKVDQLINLVGELVITQSMLLQTGKALDPVKHEKHMSALMALERSTRDLQESVLSIRLLPVSFLFSRFPRVVRDLASKLKKEVELVIIGEQTELDKSIIERLTDPLAHLVRNSIDHGIERPDERVASGKPKKGQVTLSAAHEAGSILIEIIDDGKGLDRERILAKAAENGLPSHDAMTDGEVWNLIFLPGFSTAETVTDVSGRGVGMDVVRRNILELGGRIEISSVKGEGSRFSVRLPLTLAILDGMIVSVAGEVFVLPLGAVVESVQLLPERIKDVQGRNPLMQMRGEYIPLIDAAKEFHMERAQEAETATAVVIESEGRRVALLVDELLGQQQVVIKNVEKNYRRIPGFSGATIMGDGSVALILDVSFLISHSAA
ncbi:chemotaxis protein CheA [Allohahella sp. A8]|uniref:chemotaxis protein CheA n=1 Tax=Allohahella sp. A8 TaxID=3141461 RepID=UPI003A7F95B3